MTVETVVVDGGEGSVRLDRWFKRHYPALVHARLEKLLRTGLIRVDGRRARAGDRITPGQVIRIPPLGEAPPMPHPPAARPPAPEDETMLQRAILHRDEALIALDKPPGLAVQGGSETERHVDALLDALRFGYAERPRLVHRLDKDTSGILVIARTAAAAAFLARAFRDKRTRKIYWAIVVGVPDAREGTIDAPLAKQPGTGGEKMHIDEEHGLPAKTRWRVLDHAGNRAAWVELQPLTGRTHQLRAHMAAIGHPIVGDAKYGGAEAFLTGGISRKLHLHARRIRIDAPDGGKIDVTAELPPHFAETLATLGFDQSSAERETVERPVKRRAPKPKPPTRRGERRSRGSQQRTRRR
jgi:23S rRNA pseudouridine955/2504/2580 synthase